MRHVNADAKLAEWAAGARERELEKLGLKHTREQERLAQREAAQQVRRRAWRAAAPLPEVLCGDAGQCAGERHAKFASRGVRLWAVKHLLSHDTLCCMIGGRFPTQWDWARPARLPGIGSSCYRYFPLPGGTKAAGSLGSVTCTRALCSTPQQPQGCLH